VIFADIASGEVDAADVLFLIAAIVFGLTAVLYFVAGIAPEVRAAALAAGLCLVSVAWLIL